MTIEEERIHLQEQVTQRDERIQQLVTALEQQGILMQQVQALQERQAKDSHNSSLPPPSDRFTRKTKSLRKKSEKKSGGQEGHRGTSLAWSSPPDEIIEQSVEQCDILSPETGSSALVIPLANPSLDVL